MSAKQAIVEKPSEVVRTGKPKRGDFSVIEGAGVSASDIYIDASRDANLTEFGKKTLEDRYLLPGETFQGMFARVSA
ncbi:MAG: ribonucleotide-diphosphate reductase subunit alpha, partial [Pseudomonadota bacterium]